MDRRTLVEFVVAWFLVLLAAVVIILPIFNISNIKNVFVFIISFYGIIHIIKNSFILKSQDYSGFRTAAASLVVLIILLFLDVNDSPWNLALVLFIWVILMSLTKLKESDYYHDRANKLWELNIVNLILFIVTGILASISLNYYGDVQIIVLGFFFLINAILELMDPLAAYLITKK